jgi:hypothetical protein
MQADELRDASRERLLAEIGALQHQYSISNQHQLLGRVRELEMALLQSRDYSMGLSAEVGELRAAIAVLHRNDQKLRKTVAGFYKSRTWRAGRVVMLPIRIAKRILKTK